MGLSIIEMTIDRQVSEFALDALKGEGILGAWRYPLEDGQMCLRVLALSEEVERILDLLERNYGSLEEFRSVVLSVEASLPRLEASRGVLTDRSGRMYDLPQDGLHERISREELYVTLVDASNLSPRYVALIILSSIVAAIGLLQADTSIIIGSMVIAPMLGPNMALSLGTIIGDRSLMKRAIKTDVVGIGGAFFLGVAIGAFLPADHSFVSRQMQASVGLSYVALALAAGTAGALAFTTRLSLGVVGVTVAVALFPPLVTTGLLVGMGHISTAGQSALIFLTNLIGINVSSIITFLVQGIRPGRWDESERAKKTVTIGLLVWLSVLIGCIVLIVLRSSGGGFSSFSW
jgi:uncharacterized hydrophobic protein (TIGR00341 family)